MTPLLIQRALGGDPQAARQLAQHIVLSADRQIRALLRRNPTGRNRGLSEELVHDVAVYLYAHDGKLLRGWDESRGSFDYYVGLVARRLTCRRLTQFRGNPACLTPVADMQPLLPQGAADEEITHALALDRVLRHVEHEMEPSDWRRFHARFIEQLSIEEQAAREGVSANAIHAWASRLRRRLREQLPDVIAVLEGADDPPSGSDDGVKE
ncbi:MAG: hypothetical protein KDK70_13515 [Myxococcales bacterium]|nr:hypothetical protein [Myxococcales bacterium]